ncbi:MAG: sugar phosphate isomerase/epimerase [Hungatella sp.]|jgi:L-ribulose-5-phosphate 3-epimerase|nr:sugar phosphate isomerase/epimerase [Hungatella sp.]
MNFGMRCHDICPKADMDTVFDAVKNNGIDQIQLALGKSVSGYDFNYGHYSPGFGRLIGRKLKERDIHVAVLGCYINPVNPVEKTRQAEVSKFIEHLKYAKAMGADMVGTETGRYSAAFDVVPYTYTEGCYQLLLKSMRQIVSAAEKLGVIVGIEAVHDHTLYCPEMMRRFLEDIDSPNVEAILDPVNLISRENHQNQDQVIEDAFKLYGDRISVIHVKDFVMKDGEPEFAYVGTGLLHFETLMKKVKEQKPYIAMLLENSNPQRYHGDVEYLQGVYDRV